MEVDGRLITAVNAVNRREWGRKSIYTPTGLINGNSGTGVARGRLSAYIPEWIWGIPEAAWLAWRDGVVSSESAALGEGLSTYLNDLTVLDLSGLGSLIPHTISYMDHSSQVSTLDWSTRDYWYYDQAQQLYMSIDATFSGVESEGGATSCTMTVSLTIEHRGQSISKPLFSGPISISNILPLVGDAFTEYGPYLPAPLLRAQFAPKFRQQGVFPGVVHTTLAEEASGATPHCLMSFQLRLYDYGGVSEDGQESIGNSASVVPGLLLEMLYAYVYSNQYGIDEDEAYPIERSGVAATLASALFSESWTVNYHNGALTVWKNALGAAYQNITTVEVFRT